MDMDLIKSINKEKNTATPVTSEQMELFNEEMAKFRQFKAPTMWLATESNVEKKVFNAFFDGTSNNGTSNDEVKSPHRRTNVHYMYTQVGAVISEKELSKDVIASYIPGPGTGKNSQYTGKGGDTLGELRMAARQAEVPKMDSLSRSERLERMTSGAASKSYHFFVRPLEKFQNSKNSDGLKGWSADSRAESMYERLAQQTEIWKVDAKTRGKDIEVVVSTCGFSRGADTSALFLNKVEKRGIRNPDSFEMAIDKNGLRHFNEKTVSEQDKYLIDPGKVPMTAIFLDPVGTGDLVDKHNRQLPAGLVSGLQINAMEEKRSSFKMSTIIPFEGSVNGQSEDGRLLSVNLRADHSDVGGSHAIHGMSSRSYNVAARFFNAQYEEKMTIPLKAEPHWSDSYVHDSTKSSGLFKLEASVKGKIDRSKPEGQNRKVNPTDSGPTQPLPMNPRFQKYRDDGNLNSVSAQEAEKLERETREPNLTDVLNKLSDAARKRDRIPQEVVNRPSNPALAARAQGAQRQQAQLPAEPQPPREPTPPTQNAGQPRR